MSLVKMRVPARYGTFWVPHPTNPKKDVAYKAGDIVEVPERVARAYGWSPEGVIREAEEMAQKAREAEELAMSARAAAEEAKRVAEEATAKATALKKPAATEPAKTDPAKGGKGA